MPQHHCPGGAACGGNVQHCGKLHKHTLHSGADDERNGSPGGRTCSARTGGLQECCHGYRLHPAAVRSGGIVGGETVHRQ